MTGALHFASCLQPPGSSASVTDLSNQLELVKETGGGCETGESTSASVCLCARETKTLRMAKTISQLVFCPSIHYL